MRLLSERIEKKLSESDIDKRREELILEYAFFRDDFKHHLLYLTSTIIAHFALIVYSQMTNRHEETLNHWKGELRDRIVEFQEMDTKPKKGNRKMVEKVLLETWIDNLELPTHPNIISRRFKNKFEEEGIKLSNAEVEILTQAFITNIPNIISQMAYGDANSALEYVNNIHC